MQSLIVRKKVLQCASDGVSDPSVLEEKAFHVHARHDGACRYVA